LYAKPERRKEGIYRARIIGHAISELTSAGTAASQKDAARERKRRLWLIDKGV
jgi:hypothetical protein